VDQGDYDRNATGNIAFTPGVPGLHYINLSVNDTTGLFSFTEFILNITNNHLPVFDVINNMTCGRKRIRR